MVNKYGKYKVWISKQGYPSVWIGGKSVYLHVYVWEQENGSKPKGYDIHHIDEDKKNFNLKNLKLVTQSEHQRIHAGWIMKDSEWIKKPCNKCKNILTLNNFYYVKTRNIESNFCKDCHNKTVKERKSLPGNSEKLKKYYRDYYEKKKFG